MDIEMSKEIFFEEIKGKGATCPCCGRWGKIAARKFNLTMARSLMWIHRMGQKRPKGWVDVLREAPKDLLRTNQYGTLKHWNLIEKAEKAGVWRCTWMGTAFAQNMTTIKETVFVYNDKAEGFGGDNITIRETFEKYNHQDSMSDYMNESL